MGGWRRWAGVSASATLIGSAVAAVLDRDTGVVALGAGGAAPFYAASIAKLYTVVDVLHRAETGAVTVTDAELDRIRRALSASDDAAMNTPVGHLRRGLDRHRCDRADRPDRQRRT